MERPKVFIASSSETLNIADSIMGILLGHFRSTIEIKPWKREFELGKTYIESLEKIANDSDFVILVLGPDDVTISRATKRLSPRDNVIFELGLFMGCLGRERCFLVQEENNNLKIPSDLLGIHVAKFNCPPDDKITADNNLSAALDHPCFLIKEKINKLGVRQKLDHEFIKTQLEIRDFCNLVQGYWWQYCIEDDGKCTLSFFQIKLDPCFNSVCLGGKTYNEEGVHKATWNSVMARLNLSEDIILYHWQGWHPQQGQANIAFHGFGDFKFYTPTSLGAKMNRGEGKYWTVNEVYPSQTVIKSVEIRRTLDETTVDKMSNGTHNQIASIIKKNLHSW
jgi:hypothetical protein